VRLASKPFNKYILDSRTVEVVALVEVHTLHAFGEHDLVDSTCEREGKEGEKIMRNEESSATGRLKPYCKIWEVTFTQMLPYPSPSCQRGSGPSCPREDATA